jgi:hypothetical protein
MQHRHEILLAGTTVDDSDEHTILKKITDTIQYKSEVAFMGMESDQANETTHVICDRG